MHGQAAKKTKAFLYLEFVGRSLHPTWVDGPLGSQKRCRKVLLQEISAVNCGGTICYKT